ncbi:MAG: terminase small subunit [Rhodospirillum sp.]|nr:terminase small subunit [Rhodospirillum sp.]MCF8499652.1 terminase small subunit [Rhodospirillum sp.]
MWTPFMAPAPVKPVLAEIEERFVECYLNNGRNGAKAWREAVDGEADCRRAYRRAAGLLRRPTVQAALERAEQRALARTEALIERYAISEERVLGELASLAFSRPLDLMRFDGEGKAEVRLTGLSDREAAAIKELTVHELKDGTVKVQVKLADKLRALTMLGAKLGIWGKARQDGTEGAFGDGLSALLEEAARLAERDREEVSHDEATNG